MKETRPDGVIPFLDTITTLDPNAKLTIGVYRKPTYTENITYSGTVILTSLQNKMSSVH